MPVATNLLFIVIVAYGNKNNRNNKSITEATTVVSQTNCHIIRMRVHTCRKERPTLDSATLEDSICFEKTFQLQLPLNKSCLNVRSAKLFSAIRSD